MVHKECSRHIGESHWHNQELKGAKMGVKGCLPLVATCDVNIVIASMQIELAVDIHSTELVKEVCDDGDWVLILFGDLVEVPEVHTKLQATIIFLGKEDRGTGWRLGDWMNP